MNHKCKEFSSSHQLGEAKYFASLLFAYPYMADSYIRERTFDKLVNDLDVDLLGNFHCLNDLATARFLFLIANSVSVLILSIYFF